MTEKTYRMHNTSVENRTHENPKAFWSLVSSKRNDTSNPSSFMCSNEESTEPQHIVDAFANHFTSVYGDYSHFYDDINCQHQTITVKNITIADVEKAIKCIKPKRAVGHDGIPQYIYKACSEFLLFPLTYVFNFIIQNSQSPHDWTVSAVTLIPKITNTNNIADYRPIANIPIPNKILEKVTHMKTYPHVHKAITDCQHGIVRTRTVETNLMELTHYIAETIDKKPQTQIDLIYTDLQKAIDEVNHEILLQKLFKIGFSISMVALFGDCHLRQSRQYVIYNGVQSHTYKFTSGVPQGGILAPLFFLIYINDILEVISTRFLCYLQMT